MDYTLICNTGPMLGQNQTGYKPNDSAEIRTEKKIKTQELAYKVIEWTLRTDRMHSSV